MSTPFLFGSNVTSYGWILLCNKWIYLTQRKSAKTVSLLTQLLCLFLPTPKKINKKKLKSQSALQRLKAKAETPEKSVPKSRKRWTLV